MAQSQFPYEEGDTFSIASWGRLSKRDLAQHGLDVLATMVRAYHKECPCPNHFWCAPPEMQVFVMAELYQADGDQGEHYIGCYLSGADFDNDGILGIHERPSLKALIQRLEDARLAIAKPAENEGVMIEDAALDAVVTQTQCYPYFLQEWGKHLWDVADASPITLDNVHLASQHAIAALDQSFFLVRFDRLTQAEKRYVRAMASLGSGPHRSGDIASELNRAVSSLAPTRSQLISKGMIWSPSHGDTAFTVPMFDEFMLRIMPGDNWRQTP